MTTVCAWCQKEDRLLTILNGTPVEQALLDLEAGNISHGACKPHFDREWQKVLARPDRRVRA